MTDLRADGEPPDRRDVTGILPPPLTDLSDAGLIAAIEADLVATRILAPEVPVEIHDDGDAVWGIAAYPDPYRSLVVSARFAAGTADRRIAEIARAFAARGTGFLWWVAPFHTPSDLGTRLERAGLRLEGTAPAMAMDLHSLPRDEPLPPGLEIRAVRDRTGLRAFLSVFEAEAAPDEAAANLFARHGSALLRAIPPKLPVERVPLRYYGMLDGRAVAAARISIGGGVAGLYSVTTLPEARRRGIGRAMTLAALTAGRELGYRVGVLQASDDGLPVYRKLGFRALFHYAVYIDHQMSGRASSAIG